MNKKKLTVLYKRFLVIVTIFISVFLNNNTLYARQYIISYPSLGINYEWKNMRAVVTEVDPQSNIFKAGLRKGDGIGMFHWRDEFPHMISPNNELQFLEAVYQLPPGKKVTISVFREGLLQFDFIVEEKQAILYFNDNLRKIIQSRTDENLLTYSTQGLSRSHEIYNNYVKMLNYLEMEKETPEVAEISTLTALYTLYDKTDNGNNKLNTGIYSMVNFFIYNSIKNISLNIHQILTDNKMPQKGDLNLSIYFKKMMNDYYSVNYNEMPEIKNTLSIINDNLSKLQAKNNATISSIEKKYMNVQGGWKFLKWGMSIDEVNSLLIKNGMSKLSFQTEFVPHIRYDDEYGDFQSKIIQEGESDFADEPNRGRFHFYFIDAKLIAVRQYFRSEDNIAVVNQLKKKYPNGIISNADALGYRKYFSYNDNNLIICMYDVRRSPEVWFVSPKIKKIKSDIEYFEKQKRQKESEDRAKKLF